jgi:hypothetical protein
MMMCSLLHFGHLTIDSSVWLFQFFTSPTVFTGGAPGVDCFQLQKRIFISAIPD